MFMWGWYVCFSGHYCEFAVSSTTQCREGTYMPYGVDPNNLNSGVLGGGNCVYLFCRLCPLCLCGFQPYNRTIGSRIDKGLI